MIKSASLFSQLLNQIPRRQFQLLINKHQAERHSKGFQCWTQLVSMLFCHFAHADSLRDTCNGLTCTLGKLRHLGIEKGPCRSTLSYANAHRPANLFRDLFFQMLQQFRSEGLLGHRKSKFRFKNKLLSLDSTTISLCLNLFPWAEFRKAKGGVKLHVLLDHDDYMPSFILVSEARRHDKTMAKKFTFTPGTIVAFDRAYIDDALDKLDIEFDTHDFIRALAQTSKSEYAKSLQNYIDKKNPFGPLHVEIAHMIRGHKNIEHMGELKSADLFGEITKCQKWRKIKNE